jgi:hypothetical protein
MLHTEPLHIREHVLQACTHEHTMPACTAARTWMLRMRLVIRDCRNTQTSRTSRLCLALSCTTHMYLRGVRARWGGASTVVARQVSMQCAMYFCRNSGGSSTTCEESEPCNRHHMTTRAMSKQGCVAYCGQAVHNLHCMHRHVHGKQHTQVSVTST